MAIQTDKLLCTVKKQISNNFMGLIKIPTDEKKIFRNSFILNFMIEKFIENGEINDQYGNVLVQTINYLKSDKFQNEMKYGVGKVEIKEGWKGFIEDIGTYEKIKKEDVNGKGLVFDIKNIIKDIPNNYSDFSLRLTTLLILECKRNHRMLVQIPMMLELIEKGIISFEQAFGEYLPMRLIRATTMATNLNNVLEGNGDISDTAIKMQFNENFLLNSYLEYFFNNENSHRKYLGLLKKTKQSVSFCLNSFQISKKQLCKLIDKVFYDFWGVNLMCEEVYRSIKVFTTRDLKTNYKIRLNDTFDNGQGLYHNCINLPEGITSIHCDFKSCDTLTEIVIPGSVKTLSDYCFSECSSLRRVVICEGVESLGSYCFSKCSSLRQVEIPGSIKSLGNQCFSECSSLSQVVICEGVESLGDYCFSECSSLSQIVICEGVESLGDYCFFKCSSLSQIEIPGSIKSLGEYCYSGCSSLRRVVICEGVESLGMDCFQYCGFEEIDIPASVTSVGSWCFASCKSLKKITLTKTLYLDEIEKKLNGVFKDTPILEELIDKETNEKLMWF